MAKATKEKLEVQNDLFVAPPIKEKSAIQKVDDIKKGVGDLAIRMAAINIKTDDDYKAAVALGVDVGDTLKTVGQGRGRHPWNLRNFRKEGQITFQDHCRTHQNGPRPNP